MVTADFLKLYLHYFGESIGENYNKQVRLSCIIYKLITKAILKQQFQKNTFIELWNTYCLDYHCNYL